MSFFKEDNTILTITEEPIQNTLIASTHNPNSSCLADIDSAFSFSDLTCCACFCLVPVFGAAGIGLGYAITLLLLELVKQSLDVLDSLAFGAPPFIGMFVFMGLAFCIWGRSVDWAMAWEVATSSHRDRGLMAACKYFISSSCLALTQSTNEENVLPVNEDSEHLIVQIGC